MTRRRYVAGRHAGYRTAWASRRLAVLPPVLRRPHRARGGARSAVRAVSSSTRTRRRPPRSRGGRRGPRAPRPSGATSPTPGSGISRAGSWTRARTRSRASGGSCSRRPVSRSSRSASGDGHRQYGHEPTAPMSLNLFWTRPCRGGEPAPADDVSELRWFAPTSCLRPKSCLPQRRADSRRLARPHSLTEGG